MSRAGPIAAPFIAALAMCAACGRAEERPLPAPASAEASASAESAPDLSKLAAFEPPPRGNAQLVELGKLLFFDARLSGDDTSSCSTCHDPGKGWSDGRPKGVGHKGKALARNVPSVVNPDARLPMFWDGRAKTVEEQALGPVESPDEMAQPLDDLVRELGGVAEYVARFEDAFPKRGITKEGIAAALAAFERTLVSADAPLDRWLGGDHTAMSPEAVRGMGLFVGKAACTKCHEGAHLTDASFHNIGVRGDDVGRFKIVDLPVLRGAFRTPGLRDVALTAPYLHDGSAPTLEEVMELYDRGGDDKTNLDADIAPLHLTAQEKADLVAFMHALTGKPIVVAPPRVPRTASASKKPLVTLMKETDGMLDTLDKTFASLGESDWAATAANVEQLLDNAENVAPRRTKIIKQRDYGEFLLFQGRLILAVRDLQASVARRSRADAMRTYDAVRDRCSDCHNTFRLVIPPRR